jgi:hypothetical protein
MTTETFFTTSGSSPPVDDTDGPPLPPELVEALASLLADALVADIRQFPNFAELQPNHEPTVESPSGLHRRPPFRTRKRRDPGARGNACPARSPREVPPLASPREQPSPHPEKLRDRLA